MKKILALALSVLMILALVACGQPADTTAEAPESTPETPVVPETPETPDNVIAPEIEDGTWGAAFWAEFQNAVAVEGATTESIINALYASDAGKGVNNAMVSPVMEGYLPGFSADITGFKSGATLASMMMGVPFAAYVFELEADANMRQFVKLLKDNSDPAWNICTTAEMTTIGAVDNFALLVHSDIELPAISGGAASVIEPQLADGSKAAAVWSDFLMYMDINGSFSLASDVADYLVANEAFGASASVEILEEMTEIEGFAWSIEAYLNGALVEGDGLSAYIFQLEPGMMADAWGDYNLGMNAPEGANAVWGAHGLTLILIIEA